MVEAVVSDVGAPGEIVSIVIDRAEEVVDVLPAVSVAVVVNECVPSLRAEDVIEKAPLLSAMADPKSVDPL